MGQEKRVNRIYVCFYVVLKTISSRQWPPFSIHICNRFLKFFVTRRVVSSSIVAAFEYFKFFHVFFFSTLKPVALIFSNYSNMVFSVHNNSRSRSRYEKLSVWRLQRRYLFFINASITDTRSDIVEAKNRESYAIEKLRCDLNTIAKRNLGGCTAAPCNVALEQIYLTCHNLRVMTRR